MQEVPADSIMDMQLQELISFTVNFNLIRRKLAIAYEEDFATDVQ